MAQQREPDDPAASPLAILRTAVYDYQAVRDGARKKLQDSKPEVRGLGDREPDHRQHQWYRSLLEQVRAQGELGNLKATHALMDAVKAVLDRSSEFGAEDFWLCLSQMAQEDGSSWAVQAFDQS
eukprot:g18017.t1